MIQQKPCHCLAHLSILLRRRAAKHYLTDYPHMPQKAFARKLSSLGGRPHLLDAHQPEEVPQSQVLWDLQVGLRGELTHLVI